MKSKLKGILTLLLALVVQITFAQEKTISGTVSESSGALPGVSVVIKGTTISAATDFDGKFELTTTQKSGEIVISFLGFETKTITLSCGKLTTGVTVPQWSSMLMLRNSAGEVIAEGAPWAIGSNAFEVESATRSIGAFPLAAIASDPVLLVSLMPGAYTVQLVAAEGEGGEALGEIYALP